MGQPGRSLCGDGGADRENAEKSFVSDRNRWCFAGSSVEKETIMKTQVSLLAAVMTVFVAAGSAFAQQAAPAASAPPSGAVAAPPDMSPVANPVSGFVKAGVARYGKNMVAAAESMPAEKYGFKPSPEMNSFVHLMMHIAQLNNTFCAKISGQTAPDVKMAETNPKDKLVAAIKDTFAFCTAG